MALWARIGALFVAASVFFRISYLFRRMRASERSTSRLIDNLSDGIIILDHNARIRTINREASRILDVEQSCSAGRPVEQAAPRWSAVFQAILQQPAHSTTVGYQQDGQYYAVLASPSPDGMLIVIHNNTARHEIEAAARKDRHLAEERAARLEIIKDLAETLNQVLPPEKALEAGLELVARQVGAQTGWLLAVTPENKAVLSAGYQIPEYLDLARHREFHWPLCACLREHVEGRLNDPIRVFNCERLSRTPAAETPSIQHHLSIAVRASGKPVGILNLIVPPEREFDASEIRMLAIYGEQFGGALERVRLFAEVHKMAITDPLTELYNRRHFFELAEKEFERVRRYGRTLSVAMIDVDLFKGINDTYGHQAGDVVLKAVAQIAAESIRKNDILARYGGEELIILMPETSHDNAMQAMERLRTTIENAEIVTPRGPVRTTISVGMSYINDETMPDLMKLIDQADQALYTAKSAGRNQVCTWQIKPV